jgi:hypothetical protein
MLAYKHDWEVKIGDQGQVLVCKKCDKHSWEWKDLKPNMLTSNIKKRDLCLISFMDGEGI